MIFDLRGRKEIVAAFTEPHKELSGNVNKRQLKFQCKVV